VRGQGTRSVAALAAAVLLTLAFAACGSSDSTTTGSSSSQSGTGQDGGKSDKGSGASGPKAQTAPLEVSGGGSAQYRVRRGDNSIQEFGEESDEAALKEAASVLHDYLVARAEEDWPAACANLAETVKEQLQVLASRSERSNLRGCAATLEALTPRLPPSVRRELTIVDAGSLRIEGERAFLIYRGAEGATYTVQMVPEDGWKVGSLAATPLS